MSDRQAIPGEQVRGAGTARWLDVAKLIGSIVVCEAAGGVGSLFTAPAIGTWYVTLDKPWFTPPNWLFAPAWATLFLLMGIAVFLVWRKGLRHPGVKLALVILAVQLVLNVLWSVVFFGLRSPLGGVVEICFLWVAIVLTIVAFWRVSVAAGVLLLPYIVWVSFAAALNVSVFILNP